MRHWTCLIAAAAAAAAAVVWLLWTVAVRRAQAAGRLAVSGPLRFPLGSLGGWDDLLVMNRTIEKDTRDAPVAGVVGGSVAQFTFWKQAAAVVDARHVQAVLKQSVSRALSPAFLNDLGLRHFRPTPPPKTPMPTHRPVLTHCQPLNSRWAWIVNCLLPHTHTALICASSQRGVNTAHGRVFTHRLAANASFFAQASSSAR